MASRYDGELRIRTRIDSDGMRTGVNDINTGLGKIKSSILKIVSMAAFVKLGKDAIEMASDLQEVQNVVDVAFEDMSYKMEEFAKTSIDSFGISELSAKQTGSTYMAMAKGMGLASDTASDMAIQLTGLSADMASFYNVSQDVASTGLKSVFTGETETLKQYGIVMTETNLQEYAYAKGINKKISAMTQAEKVQLRYAYVMEQTKQAQGDFARTSDSWANQTRILSERFKQLLSILGQGLIVTLTPAIKLLNQLMSYLIQVADTMNAVISELFGVDFDEVMGYGGAVMDDVTSSAIETGQAIEDVGTSSEEASKKINNSLGKYDDLNVISKKESEDTTSDIGSNLSTGLTGTGAVGEVEKQAGRVQDVAVRLKSIIDDLARFTAISFGPSLIKTFKNFEKNLRDLEKILKNVWRDISKLGKPLKDYFKRDFIPFIKSQIELTGTVLNGLFDTFKLVFEDIWNKVVYPSLNTMVTDGLPVITQFCTECNNTFAELFESTKEIFDRIYLEGISPILSQITSIWQEAVGILKSTWDKHGTAIFSDIREAISNTKDILLSLWQSCIEPIVKKICAVIDELWDSHLKLLYENIAELCAEFIEMALALYNNGIAPVVEWLTKVLGPTFSNIFGLAADIVKTSIGIMINLVNDFIAIAKSVIIFLKDFFKGDWEKLWDDLKNILKAVWDNMVDIVKEPINLIIGMINAMINALETALNHVVNGINSLSFETPDWLPGKLANKKFGFDLEPINWGNIPYLATGAVLPANNPFLAVVGDQKSGTNIEAPAKLIKQMAKEAIEEAGVNSDTDVQVNIYLEGDSEGIFKIVKTEYKKEKKRKPNKPVFE